MSCERYLDLISARLDAPLSAEDEAELTAHLNTCPDCRAIADDLANIHSTLSGAAAVPPAELATGVMNTIRGKRRPSKRTLRQFGTLAACLVLCVGLFALIRPEPTGTPADTPNIARHVQPYTESGALPFSNQQRLRLSAMSTSFQPTADLLGSAEELSQCFARFPYNNLSNLAETYNEEYFLSHRLLAAVVCEPSSSITHTIDSLTEDSITIVHTVPEAGDCDEALWLILAEVEGAGPGAALTVELLPNS